MQHNAKKIIMTRVARLLMKYIFLRSLYKVVKPQNVANGHPNRKMMTSKMTFASSIELSFITFMILCKMLTESYKTFNIYNAKNVHHFY